MRTLSSVAGAGMALALCATTPSLPARAAEAPRTIQDLLGPNHAATLHAASQALQQPSQAVNAADRVRRWNQVAIDASGLDHTPVKSGETRVFGEQLGPARAARAVAIMHIAIADSVSAIMGGFQRYTNIPPAPAGASVDTAIATAAHNTLAALFPSQAPHFQELLVEDLVDAPGSLQAKIKGVEVGTLAAAAILAQRDHDGSHHTEPRMGSDYIPGPNPGEWRQDPISQAPIALGTRWKEVKPFVMQSAAQFRVPPFPALSSREYAEAYDEVRRLGGDGVTTPTERTLDQTRAGIYWAYDGTPSLCAPPRLYNQIATKVWEGSTDVVALARLYALINVAMADAAIAIWESKYHYKIWRPVTGIREANPGTGPTGLGDGNSATVGDPAYSPLGAPASNLTGPNFTPPFPAYPSGHAGFGGALFQILRNLAGTDNVTFTFTSDEFNGQTVGNDGKVRPLLPRTFRSFSQAEEENGQSRIYLGIHWSFDKVEGIRQGQRVADYVFSHAFRPTSN